MHGDKQWPQVPFSCVLASGVYRETVTLTGGHARGERPARGIVGADDDVIISGLDVLPKAKLDWRRETSLGGCIWSTPLPSGTPSDFQQLFYESRVMIEARWPNLDVNDVFGSALSRRTWQTVGSGSRYGHVEAPALASQDFSWDGALATLNVAHQFYTWTRVVRRHRAGQPWFEYDRDLPSLASTAAHPNATWAWGCDIALREKCNQFFLSGKLGALDMAGEWHVERGGEGDAPRLYFWPPEPRCAAPSATLEVKVRDYAVDVQAGSADVRLARLTLLGATVRLVRCTRCTLDGLRLHFPAYERESLEMNPSGPTRRQVVATYLDGEALRVTNLTLMHTNNHGLKLNGTNVSVRNCLVSHTDTMGTLSYQPLGVSGNQISVRQCTVKRFGNAGVVTHIPNTLPTWPNASDPPVPQPMEGRRLEVAYSHIHSGGSIGMDTALLYTGGWSTAGLEWHHNWVHDADEKCIRADDQSRNMSVHHNVAFGCGLAPHADVNSASSGIGCIIKGEGHLLYANTFARTNYTELCLPACLEPRKAFRKQYPLALQNRRTQLFNSVARRKVGWPCSCYNRTEWLHHPGGNATANYEGFASFADLKLVDPAHLDFSPRADSPLVDAGAVVPPYTDGFVGAAPDIGAYEYGGERWTAGCVGLEGC